MRRLFLLAFLASPLAAQAPVEGAFVVRLGRDTIAVERFRRTADRIDGEFVAFAPATRVVRYTMQLTTAGTVHAMEARVYPGIGGAGATPSMVASMTRRDTLVTTIIQRGDRTDTVRLVVRPTTVPMISPSVMVYDQMARQAVRQGGDSVRVDTYSLGSRTSTPNAVVRRSPDSVSVFYGPDPHYLAVDAQGQLLGLNGARTTNKMVVERVTGAVDIAALAVAGVARERAGAGAGALSTRDTVRASAGGGEVTVDYGRPAARGRQILGTVVPFGEVWRTGANTATQFTTTRDLRLGQAVVPAGSYSLWTLPTAAGVELIVNRQTGQWGTEYDRTRDLVRIPMEVGSATTPVERFTIAIEPRAGGSVLVLSWHTFVWRVPITLP